VAIPVRVICQDFTMADAEGFDPALLAESQRVKNPSSTNSGIREMAVQLSQSAAVGDRRSR
jgi:hypothetical protein